MHTAARVFEARRGPTPMSPPDRTARRGQATGEAEKAARRGLSETAREFHPSASAVTTAIPPLPVSARISARAGPPRR
ncbi:hypothetical protein, partial [Streptomyces sp. NPDC127040]|uniref:hypothetical protein n=1 Tax=Streptomyces sp. NPDC127040 TaxID=3347116 RepID=UPI003669513E